MEAKFLAATATAPSGASQLMGCGADTARLLGPWWLAGLVEVGAVSPRHGMSQAHGHGCGVRDNVPLIDVSRTECGHVGVVQVCGQGQLLLREGEGCWGWVSTDSPVTYPLLELLEEVGYVADLVG